MNPLVGLNDFERMRRCPEKVAKNSIRIERDRRDEDLRTVGRLSAKLDRVVVREDKYRRGREPGEISRLIIEGLHEAGMDDSQIEIIYNETEVLAHALSQMEDNDLVFVLADDVPAVLAQLDTLSGDRLT